MELLTIIYIILGTSTTFVILIDEMQLMEWVKRKLYYIRFTKDSVYEPYNLKPFDCGKCLSFWTSLIIIYTITSTITIYTLPIAFVSAYMAIILRKILIY